MCKECGRDLEAMPSNEIRMKVDFRCDPRAAVITRGHIVQWLQSIIDGWYAADDWEPIESGTIINTIVAQQTPPPGNKISG